MNFKKYFASHQILTEFGYDNAEHNKEWSKELNSCDISLEDEFVETGCDDSSEAAEKNPKWRWYKYQASLK